jgi:hypothetical protein
MRILPDGPPAELPNQSRRLVIAELVAAAIVVSIPVGALIATARPIENPPDLRSLQSPRIPKSSVKRPRKSETRTRDDLRRKREEQRAERAKSGEAKTP